ncbi:MAG TPA: efflux RND transporter periplasmic adaptor subunit [Sphingomonadales bacterium]|nr:efflux RND transporter periplasmic adaptor subunit [Sphingomonadales bacterium]
MAKISFDKSWLKGAKLLWLLAGALILFGSALILYAALSGGDETHEARAVPVEVELASPYLFADIIEAIGTALANESVTLTAKVSDKVKAVNFEDGARVRRGDIIVTLNNSEELANVSAALAAVTEAEKAYERSKSLVETGNLSQASLDTATRNLSQARASLDAARARAGNYVITAPFDGVLGLRQVSPGTLVSPGTQITTLDDVSIIKVDFSVPEKFLSALSRGQEIVSHAAAFPARQFRGVVKTVDTRVDPVTRTVTVRAEIPNPEAELRPGMLLTVDLLSNARKALSVPENAVVPVGEGHFVFRISADGLAQRTPIEAGGRYKGRVEVLSGLKEGDPVVYSGTVNLQDGIPARVLLTREPPGLPPELAGFLAPEEGAAKEAADGDDSL